MLLAIAPATSMGMPDQKKASFGAVETSALTAMSAADLAVGVASETIPALFTLNRGPLLSVTRPLLSTTKRADEL